MSKGTMVSFRITENLSENLKELARKHETTVSRFVDTVLRNALDVPDSLHEDRRGFFRQRQSLAGILCDQGGLFCAVRIADISLGGAGLVVSDYGLAQESIISRPFTMAFAVSTGTEPILMQCRRIWMRQVAGRCQIGVVFCDASLESYQALRGWLE